MPDHPIKVLSIVGTRPEAIKMAPVIRELAGLPNTITSVVCSTGQHREMLQQVFSLFGLHPDIELDVMQPNQTLAGLTARLFEGLDRMVLEHRPDWVLAQGDTTTVLVASLVAYYHRVKFGHVEAGLRTGDRYRPFPEEVNRCVADVVADLMFAPTQRSRDTLLREGHASERILVTGNTVIDALQIAAAMPFDWSGSPLRDLPTDRRLMLVTAHRRESFGQAFEEMCRAIGELASRHSSDIHVVFPVHLNPNVQQPVQSILGSIKNVTLMVPLDYLSLVHLMKQAVLILTDSGGIQEEAPGLGIPVLVMRDTTERPEGVESGVVKLVGTSRARIVEESTRLLTDPDAHRVMATGINPYGDGNSAKRIVSALLAKDRS